MPLYTGQEFTKIFTFDGSSTYTDVTLEAQTPAGTSFTVLGAASHYLYLGHDERFDMAIFDIDVPAVIGTLTWQYYNGSAWTTFVPATGRMVHDPDVADYATYYGFIKDGVEIFPPNLLIDWATVAVNSVIKYWIRVIAASVTTAPTIKRIQMRPTSAYCSTRDVFNLLQLTNITDTTDFTTTTVPTKLTVEQFIEAAQSKIEFATRKAWRPHYIAEEYHDFNLNGFRLRRNDAYKILSLEIWDGGDWGAKTEGRTGDFFLSPDVGIVYFSRYFLLPALPTITSFTFKSKRKGSFVSPVASINLGSTTLLAFHWASKSSRSSLTGNGSLGIKTPQRNASGQLYLQSLFPTPQSFVTYLHGLPHLR